MWHLTRLEDLWASENKLERWEDVQRLGKSLTRLGTVYLEANPLASDPQYRRRVANLLLPCRHALLPTLSDETLRSVFALRQGAMTVVDMVPDGNLIQYHLHLEHFQPLRHALVDYFLHIHEQPLARICASTQFDFEPITLPPPDGPDGGNAPTTASRGRPSPPSDTSRRDRPRP